MPHGGARAGAGRPKELTRAAAQLDRVKDKLHAEFYISAGQLAQAMPQLTQKAIAAAVAGDMTMLKFLLELFWKIVSALPADSNSKAKEMRAQFLAIVNNYASQRPTVVDTDGQARVIEVEPVADPSDGRSLLRPIEVEVGNGGRAGG